jgi:hypothetical protein
MMLSQSIAQSLMTLIPGKIAAVLTLVPDSASPMTVSVFNAWLKPMDVQISPYGNLNLQGDETIIKIPDSELNPASNGREIRSRDQIAIGGTNYRVISARLMSLRTVWQCVVRKEIA